MKSAAAIIAAIIICVTQAQARDYGQQGSVFPVIERDLLEQIQTRLLSMQKSGEMDRRNAELKRRTLARVERPEAVTGLANARRGRSWQFDPTIILAEDILGANGERIWTRGARVNPLDSVKLRSPLLFLDGDNPAQLKWALGQKDNAKLVLTKGAPLALMRAEQRRFYFDQGGKLVRHFGIKALPARVRQNGRLLEISEIALLPDRRPAP